MSERLPPTQDFDHGLGSSRPPPGIRLLSYPSHSAPARSKEELAAAVRVKAEEREMKNRERERKKREREARELESKARC